MDSKYLIIKDVRATGSYSDTELTKLWVYKSSAGYLVIEGKDESRTVTRGKKIFERGLTANLLRASILARRRYGEVV